MYKDCPVTNYRIELPSKILRVAMREFLRHGLKSVKMDDIANLLGISKRTLYEIYSNKEELLLECIRMHEDEYDRHMTEYGDDASHNVIDIIIEFYRRQIQSVSDVSPVFFEEMHKYGHVVEFLEARREQRNRNAKAFYVRGVREGYFRKDVDFDIVLKVGGVSMEYAMRTEMYKEYSMRTILHNTLLLFLRGVCTPEGVARLDEFMDSECDVQ